MSGAIRLATPTGSLISIGFAAMSSAGSETASSIPCRSVIVPRGAGMVTVATCWEFAARWSPGALIVPT